MAKQKIGLIGFGGICGGVHLPGYKECENAEITAVCDINPERLKCAKEMLHLDDSCLFEDYRELMRSGLVSAVDIATPNSVHCKAANAAVDASIPFSVEKPVGLNYDEVKALYKRTVEKNIKSFVCLSWRYTPETRYMRDVVKNHIGRVYHMYIRCIKDSGLWEGRKLEWRFEKEKSGTGVIGDLGAHMVDIVRFMGEEFASVDATGGIYVKERESLDSKEIMPVTTDDWCNMNCITEKGVPVTIGLSRTATAVDMTQIEVYGENGAVSFNCAFDNYECKKEVKICMGQLDLASKAWHTVAVPQKYKAVQSQSFVNMLCGIEDEYTARLAEGVECQRVLEATEKSMNIGKRVYLSEIQ